MVPIQLTKDQETELLSMTRPITQADQNELNRAYAELDKKGFVFSGENFMVLMRAYNQAPQASITVQSVLEFTAKYRDAFQWLSAAEVEFRKLSDQIGPDQTALVTKELGRHGLINTPGSEELFSNFAAVVRYYQSQGWPITAGSFEKAIGNLRTSLGHASLAYRPTPNQQAAAKRWENTRASESKKSPLEVVKAKAEAAKHVMLPDGQRLSDKIMRDFYEAHPEAMETEVPKTPAQEAAEAVEAHWEKQTKDYIRSLSGHNLLQQEAEQKFGRAPLHNSWRQTYNALHIFVQRQRATKPELWA